MHGDSEPMPPSRILAQLMGWLSLGLGMAMIAVIALVPPWLELRYAQWERGFIEQCSRQQFKQIENYEQFAAGLQNNDPVLLERLAFHHLRRKPAGAMLVLMPDDPNDESAVRTVINADGTTTTGLAFDPTVLGDERQTLLEKWLHQPMPVVGEDYPAYEVPSHPAIRLATGPKRSLLLALGGVFMLCGLLLPSSRRTSTSTNLS